jgi:hypothetical protein
VYLAVYLGVVIQQHRSHLGQVLSRVHARLICNYFVVNALFVILLARELVMQIDE